MLTTRKPPRRTRATTHVPWWEAHKVDVPPGELGSARVERFTVSESEASLHNMQSMFHPGGGSRRIQPGTYTRLFGNGVLWMSDTPAEIGDHLDPIHKANGRCLVNGLGLGVVVRSMLLKDEVDRVTVVELSRDIIDLVGAHYQAAFGWRLEIIHADAMAWRPPKGERFNVVWHDIWPNICGDNLPEMHKLHRAYGRRCDWQGSWCRWLCERNR